MMRAASHVASLELCKELYKLSAWKGTFWKFYKNGDQVITHSGIKKHQTSAYDLGYLLRKLPKVSPSNQDCYLTVIHKNVPKNKKIDKRWTAGYFEGFGWSWYANADTPEDAACLLAIELFKQGILTPEPSSKGSDAK